MRNQKQSTETELQDVNEEEDYSRFKSIGLKTGLKPTFGFKTAKHGSDNLEGFLTAVEKTLLKEAFKIRRFEHQNTKTKEIYDILQRLKKSGSISVPTDKINSTKVIQIEDYKLWVSDHLSKAEDLALRAKVVSLFEDANCLLDKVKMELSVQEENFCETIASNESDPGSKIINQGPKDNQLERRIPN